MTDLLNPLPRYPPCDACEKLKDGLTALSYLDTASEAEEAEDVEEVREILGCPGVRALLQVRALNDNLFLQYSGTAPSIEAHIIMTLLNGKWESRWTCRV